MNELQVKSIIEIKRWWCQDDYAQFIVGITDQATIKDLR